MGDTPTRRRVDRRRRRRRTAGGDVPALVLGAERVAGVLGPRRRARAAALLPLALVVLQATHRSPSLAVAFSASSAVAGAVAAPLILYRIANQPGPNHAVDVQVGAWLGPLVAIGSPASGSAPVVVEPSP